MTHGNRAPQQATIAKEATAAGVGGPPPAASTAASAPAQMSAAALLAVESRVRAAKDEVELVHLVANELRRLVAGRQAIVVHAKVPGRLRVAAVSSVVVTDGDTPFVRWVEDMVARIVAEAGADEAAAIAFDLPAFADGDAAETRNYPFPHLVWQPMTLPTGELFAGVLIARERPWSEQDRKVIGREAAAFANAWQALHGAKALTPKRPFDRRKKIMLAIAAFVAAVLPVPMTTLAPVEIIARRPQRVTAPIDAVIKEILIDPNRPVKAGQPILRFEETTLRNRHQLAQQEMLLARTRFDRASQAAFQEEKARHELAQAEAEFALKQAERDYAADLLARAVVMADRDGVLVYADKDRWIGRPVRTGERIMQIVDPADTAARIEVPVADAIVLEHGARVRLFLDANPLTSVPARLVSLGYHAEPNSTHQLVYRLLADLDDKSESLRIGARGTAQLQGSYVPLIFYLLRRPISAVRQFVGL